MNLKNREFSPREQFTGFSVKPAVMVLFFLLLATYDYNRIFKVGITLYSSDFIVIAIMLLTIIQLFHGGSFHRFRKFRLLFSLLFLYYLFLIFYSYAILGNSGSMVFGRFRMLFFYPMLFFPGLLFTYNKKDVGRLLGMVEIFVLISVSIGLLSLKFPSLNLVHRFIGGDSGVEQVEAPYYMIVNLGTAVLCCLVIVYETLNILGKKGKMLKSSFFVGISLIGIIGTQNRGIYIFFILSFFLIFWFSRKAETTIRVRMKVFALLLIFIIIGIVIFLINSPLYEKFEARVNNTIEMFTGEKNFFNTIPGIRIGRTITTFKEWLKTPVLGCGWGSQILEFHIYDLQGNYIRTNYGTPHNYYITILYQTGIPGFILMICIFYGIYHSIKPRERLSLENIILYTLFIFYLSFLVFNFGNTHLYSHPVFIPVNFFLLGAAVSCSNTCLNRGEQPS